MANKRKQSKERHTFLSLEVKGYEASVDVGMNSALRGNPWPSTNDADLAFKFVTSLTLLCQCIEPEQRAGDDYTITLRGEELHHRDFSKTIFDYQKRDENGFLEWKKRRTESYPVYEPPPGLAILDKVRGKNEWSLWIYISSASVSDMLVLLGQGRKIYVLLHECMSERVR